MAQTDHAPSNGYGPDMDGASHEATYRGFTQFVEIGTLVVICWVLALALGGVRHAWLSAIVGVVLSCVAGTIGATSAFGWRAPAAVAALLVVLLILY